MELTQSIIDEVIIMARGIEHGKVIIAISGPPNDKIVDVTAEKRKRYKKLVTPKGVDYQAEDEKTA